MRFKATLLVVLTLICSLYISFGQNANKKITITGTVLDGDKKPIKGAIVCNLKRTIGQVTDENGYFSLNLTGSDTLNISCLGYQDLNFPVLINEGEHFELKIILGTKTFYDR